MNHTEKILREVPFFRHFSDNEISYLLKIGRLSKIKKNQTIDLKKTNSFNIIINGIFEIDAFGKKDILYLSPGSFFGNIPFSDQYHRGILRAVADSTLMIFDDEELYKFFVISWKGLRGYIKSLGKLGFEISGIGKKYFSENSRIVSVYSQSSGCGKSFLASLLSAGLSEFGKSITLDLTYSGNSIFNFFEKKITTPLSQKQVDNPGIEELINGRIVKVNETLDLINISFGSKIKVNSSILSPVLFILSKVYKFIIIDISDYDRESRDKAFELSDIIFSIIDSRIKIVDAQDIFTAKLSEAQRVYYVVNEYASGKMKSFEGGLVLDNFDFDPEKDQANQLFKICENEVLRRFVDIVKEKKRALILETNFLESIYYAGFLNACESMDIRFNFFYSSYFGFIVIILYLMSRNIEEFNELTADFFSEKKMAGFLEIVFPEEHVFKNSGILKYAQEICRENRIENFKSIPVSRLTDRDTGSPRLFSAGKLNEIFTSSFLIHPEFQSKKIGEGYYHSGYPVNIVQAEDLFRTDIDEFYYVAIDNKETLQFKNDRVLKFYRNYIDCLHLYRFNGRYGSLADKNIIIEAAEKKLKVEKIIEISEKSSLKLLKSL